MCKYVSFKVIAAILLAEAIFCAKLPCVSGKDPFDPDGSRRIAFDHLVLAQLWPVTECINWKSKNSKHSCNMPSNSNAFTVHGLWPSQSGTTGPNFCETNLQYSPSSLNPIIEDMRERWTDIHDGGRRNSDFWSHEWTKHGTCAQTLTPLKGVLNYFRTTLLLHRDYDVFEALSDRNIRPGGKYKLGAIYDAIIARFQAVPRVTHTPTKFGHLLNEIRLCFDRSLRIMDCSKRRNENLNLELNYPREVPRG